jgi:putative hydrolase of the HAD superfamily
MTRLQAVVFDLGGTLLEFANWDAEMATRWRAAHRNLVQAGLAAVPDEDAFVAALVEAELEHWRRVDTERWSGPPSGLVQEGYRRLGRPADERTIMAVLDACARALNGWAQPYPDAIPTLQWLREHGCRIGLLSNTWWAADWHNADLATHGLHPYLDELVYTSDLPHSKPHPEAFRTIARRLGVPAEACVMVGDRPLDDIGGGLGAGMRAVLKTNGLAVEVPPHVQPTAVIACLSELPPLVEQWRYTGSPVPG